MLDEGGSFLAREGEQTQIELLTSDRMGGELFASDEERGIYTGARLFASRPDVYRSIVSLVAEGASMRAISRATRCDLRTIAAVMQRERLPITSRKKELAELMRGAAIGLADRVMDFVQGPDSRIESAKDAQAAAIVLGIMVDKSELLSGGATERIETLTPRDTMREAAEVLREIEIEAEVIGPAGTGLQGVGAGQTREGVEGLGGAMDATRGLVGQVDRAGADAPAKDQ